MAQVWYQPYMSSIWPGHYLSSTKYFKTKTFISETQTHKKMIITIIKLRFKANLYLKQNKWLHFDKKNHFTLEHIRCKRYVHNFYGPYTTCPRHRSHRLFLEAEYKAKTTSRKAASNLLLITRSYPVWYLAILKQYRMVSMKKED